MTTAARRPRSGWRTRNGLKFKIKRAAKTDGHIRVDYL